MFTILNIGVILALSIATIYICRFAITQYNLMADKIIAVLIGVQVLFNIWYIAACVYSGINVVTAKFFIIFILQCCLSLLVYSFLGMLLHDIERKV